MSDKEEKKVEIRCSDQIANGVYANLGIANYNQEEFVLDFVFLQPHSQTGEIRSRVILHPNHAKRLVQMLSKNLENYESEYGEVSKLPDQNVDFPFDINFN